MSQENLYTIGQVSHKVNLPTYVLRFWEKEFSQFINIVRTKGNQRRYTKNAINTILTIKELAREKKIKLEGIKDILAQDISIERFNDELQSLACQITLNKKEGEI